ncbi:histidinol-phosphate transaminase [Helicovermis profundi]|uniref:Histidinol-phosphate transaminase n=1 Tax=Helicovermis profundi TaxID=3065157 RepID=A0AAU9EQ51_9FIRM|nr:histidinol-phosphate transaminase [Clostridia bacterium S502]
MNTQAIFKLNANENPYNSVSIFYSKIKDVISDFDFNLYPDTDSTDLRKAISTYVNADIDELICTNGSDELIKIIIDSLTTSDDTVLSHSPTFMEYKVFSLNRGCKYLETKANLKINIDELITTANNSNAKIVFLCNPNNPTGELISKDEIIRLLKSVKSYVVVDEAYYEFANLTTVDLINDFPNLIVMRTLSKGFALASLRIGYGVASKEIIKKLYSTKMPYNLNSFSQKIGTIAMDEREIFIDKINSIINERERIITSLNSIANKDKFDFKNSSQNLTASKANFILLKVNNKENILKKFNANNILIRDFKDIPILKDYIRFSIGTTDINNKILEIIGEEYEKI